MSNLSYMKKLLDGVEVEWEALGEVCRFINGRAYKQYLTTGINGLPNLSIYNITEDKNGLLWVGTSSGICSFNPLTEKFIHYSDVAGKVFVDKQNNIWFYAAKEFCLLNPLTKKVEKFPLSFQQKETKSNQYILSFFEDSKKVKTNKFS